MTTVPPPTTPPLPPAPPAQTAPAVLILAPPPAVAALPPGTTLEGVVLPPPPAAPDTADTRAAVTIRTPQGDVTIRLPAPLPAGTDVELQVVRAASDQATARLLTVNDQPAAQVLAQLRQAPAQAPPLPQQPVPQTPPPTATALPPASAWTPQGPTPLPALGIVSAFVAQGTPPSPAPSLQSPATPGAATGPASTSAPPLVLATGAELAVRITAVQLPAPAPSQPAIAVGPVPQQPVVTAAQTPATPAVLTPVAVAAPAPAAATPAVLPAVPPTATPPLQAAPAPQPSLPVAGPQGLPPPPPAPPQAAQPAPPQAVITGIVAHTQPGTPPVIVTERGDIQLNLRANLPAGARVTLEITAQLPPQPAASPPPLPIAALPLSGPPSGMAAAGTVVGWPNLTEAVAQLQRADPAAAAEFAAAIPDGGPRTTVAIVAFAQAMRTGDPRAWPGDTNLRALERIGPRGAHLAAQISDEVAALSTRATEHTGGEWRALPVPWNADGRIDRITLVTRREGDAEDAGGKKGGGRGTRFLINLDLSRLGPLQLDGMFRKETRGFDLMIRTKAPLSDALRLDLTGLFTASTAALGLKGGLTFQVVKKFADPLGDMGLKSGLWA